VPVLTLPEPYDFGFSTERFRRFGPDLANLWHEGGLHRVVGGREVRIEATPGGVLVEPFDDGIAAVVRKLLGLEFDLEAFDRFARGHDPILAGLVERLRGYRPPIGPDPFETLVTSITAQQVSLASAFAIRSRMIERLGVPAAHAYAFPTRERLAAADPGDLTAVGFSARKAEYVVGLAQAELDYDELAQLPDAEVKAGLVAVRGLGEWTADWFLARHLARAQAWPAGDLGLRKALASFYGDGPLPSIEEVRVTGARFAPFQNLSAHYLLANLYLAGPAA
jgi:3-methyladenine DNA glycosylase/8-oxoguanine DNA glycosylase